MFCKWQGIEWVAEQLSVSQVGLFSLTLVIINYSDFDGYNEGNLKNSYTTISFDESVYHFLS